MFLRSKQKQKNLDGALLMELTLTQFLEAFFLYNMKVIFNKVFKMATLRLQAKKSKCVLLMSNQN